VRGLSHPLADGALYSHWSAFPMSEWKWKNFTPKELASKGNGEFYYHPRTLNALQKARSALGKPLYINSGHRDWLHNLAVGGVPRSAHLWLACDISTRGHNLAQLRAILMASGFKTFGYYNRFIHADLRPGRLWYGSQEAKTQWQPIIDGHLQSHIDL